MTRIHPVRTPLRQMLSDFRRGPLTLLVWLLAVGALVWLFGKRSKNPEFIGIARVKQYEVSSVSGGYLCTLMVDLYQNVNAGQVVAQLDDTLLKAQMETALATIEQLKTQLQANSETIRTQDKFRLGKAQADLADIRATEEKRHLEVLDIKAHIETDGIDQQRLELDLTRMKNLLEKKVCSQQEYDSVKFKRDEVSRRIDENRILLARAESVWRDARRRGEILGAQAPQPADLDIVLQPMREAIHVQELTIEELSLKRKAMLLRAPISGQVVAVLCQLGQAVRPGEPILTIDEHGASEIIGYMMEPATQDLHENMEVDVTRAMEPGKTITALVSRISPVIEVLPQQLWADVNHPRYGRPFIVAVTSPQPLVPGEKMLIRANR